MAVWFISRHPGAREWAQDKGLAIDHWCDHLDSDQVQPGDTVIGTLPVPKAADICSQGAHYWHLVINLPFELRGQELSATTLRTLGAHLQQYRVEPIQDFTDSNHVAALTAKQQSPSKNQ